MSNKEHNDLEKETGLFPKKTGFKEKKPTLCIGLDFAWFGGYSAHRTSQFDFLAAVVIGNPRTESQLFCRRVSLPGRDLQADAIINELDLLIKSNNKTDRVVLAIDGPIQTIRNHLPIRQPVSAKGSVERRACDELLNHCRKRIDRKYGGPSGWHPNVQPGAPIPQRLNIFLSKINQKFGLKVWDNTNSQEEKIAIECFPAEGIWAAKRLEGFPEKLTAPVVKAYKDQGGARLNAIQVRELVETVLLEGFKQITGFPRLWPRLVEQVVSWMLENKDWIQGGYYRGGKMLDDVVDSMICLATALSYAGNKAHLWLDKNNPSDGHIIGPGIFSEEF